MSAAECPWGGGSPNRQLESGASRSQARPRRSEHYPRQTAFVEIQVRPQESQSRSERPIPIRRKALTCDPPYSASLHKRTVAAPPQAGFVRALGLTSLGPSQTEHRTGAAP